ncbi:MAG: MOSC domain-containing protein [Planctomycetota bacterium]
MDDSKGSRLSQLMESVPQRGRLMWIGLAPERRGDLAIVSEVRAEVGAGLVGDHHASTGRGKRQVSLLQAEHLSVIAELLGRAAVDPALLRRNLIVSGLNLYALRKGRLRIGDVLLEGTGVCAPCSRMEENLGPGGFHAMRGHGGITAAVIEPGVLRVGQTVEFAGLADRD